VVLEQILDRKLPNLGEIKNDKQNENFKSVETE
jgi:hypothetical protein